MNVKSSSAEMNKQIIVSHFCWFVMYSNGTVSMHKILRAMYKWAIILYDWWYQSFQVLLRITKRFNIHLWITTWITQTFFWISLNVHWMFIEFVSSDWRNLFAISSKSSIPIIFHPRAQNSAWYFITWFNQIISKWIFSNQAAIQIMSYFDWKSCHLQFPF